MSFIYAVQSVSSVTRHFSIVLFIGLFIALTSGVPRDHFPQNWLYSVANVSKVLLRQPMLIFTFQKIKQKYPPFTASQFQEIKIPASNHVWQFLASQHG